MRKNTLVKFIHEEKGVYNPDTFEYDDTKIEVHELYCNVTGASSFVKKNTAITSGASGFGYFKDGSLTIRLTYPLDFIFEKVEIDGYQYILKERIDAIGKMTCVVEPIE